MLLLVLSTNSDVGKLRKGCLKIILIYKFHHLPLETSYTIGDAKRQTGELVKVISNFKGCVRLVLIFERHLMICTAEINSAEDSVLENFINHVTYSWQRESVEERKPINGL